MVHVLLVRLTLLISQHRREKEGDFKQAEKQECWDNLSNKEVLLTMVILYKIV